jgi:hypothetical protein
VTAHAAVTDAVNDQQERNKQRQSHRAGEQGE